jgi:hypothetical protein
MADNIKQLKLASTIPQNHTSQPSRAPIQPSGTSKNASPIVTKPKGKNNNRPSTSIPTSSAPPKKTKPPKTPVTSQTRRAKAVATNLQRQDFRRAQSEPLNSVCPVITPKKVGPRGSSKTSSPVKKPNQLTLEDYPQDFVDTKASVLFDDHPM